MKKNLFALLIGTISIFAVPIVVSAEVDEEITFRDIPWGTSFSDVEENLLSDAEWSWSNLYGDDIHVFSTDVIIMNTYDIPDFKNKNLGMESSSFEEVDVAGYTTSEISLYYAFVPVDGRITHEEAATALYAAEYEIAPADLRSAFEDLLEKLKSKYGEPDTSKTFEVHKGYPNILYYWYGTNDTMLVLKKSPNPYEDTIHIIYVWKNGDTMLHDADDIVSGQKKEDESNIYGNDNTNGL